MIDSIVQHGLTSAQWLAAHPLYGFLIVLCLQVGLIAIVAAIMADKFAARHARLIYGVWLCAIGLAIALLPIHLIFGGRSIRVSTASVHGGAKHVTQSNTITAQTVRDNAREPHALSTHDRSATTMSEFESAGLRRPEFPPFANDQGSETDLRVSASSDAAVELRAMSGSARWSSEWRIAVVLGSLYLLGCLVVLARLFTGAARLTKWSRCGRAVNAATQADVVQAASQIGLVKIPSVRIVSEVTMPLLFGAFRPTVLLPDGFENWSADERRATLLHELMHIRRGDMVGQWLAKLMRVVYWFHPASSFLDRRLRESREWATDRQVVESGHMLADAMAADRYAESLLNIVARLESNPPVRFPRHTSAIAMSGDCGIEQRLLQILQDTPRRSFKHLLAGPGSFAILLLLTALTTVRLELAAAQGTPTQNQPTTPTPTEQPTGADAEADRPGRPVEETDLLARIQNCDVSTVSGDEFDAVFTVSGQVVSPAGDPVEGAIVLLRESSTNRVYSDRNKYVDREDSHLLRADDVFGRTRTDRDGQFEFRQVKSPAFPTRWTNSWKGSVIAAHDDFGLGWVALGDKSEEHRVDTDLKVTLRPTTTVSGRFVSPGQVPIENATVSAHRFIKPSKYPNRNDDLDVFMSQLTPGTQTDSEGRFKINGVPQGFAAIVQTNHSAWADGTAVIATSDDVPLGNHSYDGGILSRETILGVPAEVVADPGLLVSGQVVDSDGKPVPKVRVSYSSSNVHQDSDRKGQFRFRLRSRFLENDRQRRDAVSKFVAFAPNGSGVVSRFVEVPVDDLIAEKPIAIRLEHGVLVRGKVITDDGMPLVGANVCPVSANNIRSDITDSDGSYELLLSKKEHVIVVGTDEPGYVAPKRFEVHRIPDPADAMNLPHQRVDLTDGVERAIPPIVVSKIRSLQVIASLPDGRPAIGATAIIKDMIPVRQRKGVSVARPPRNVDRSDAVILNRLGRADLLPQGAPSEKAFVEIKLTTENDAFDARVPLSQVIDGVMTVVLEPGAILEGRVLVDGKPVAGATVSIGESTPMKRTIGRATVVAITVSNHQQAVTDKDGWYRAAVSKGKEYTVSLQQLPDDSANPGVGYSANPGVGYSATPTGDGRFRVKDFAFSRDDQEIAGRVVDRQGNPVAAARVQVMRGRDITPGFWIGHKSESQFETDNLGQFHLKNLPPGKFQLSINALRSDNQPRSVSTMTMATTGTTDLEIIFDARPPPAPRRLQPRRIEAIEQTATKPR